MKTAECEGIEETGALLAERVRGARRIGGADPRQPQREGRGRCRRARPQDRGLRRAELPPRPAHGLRAPRQEGGQRRRERRHAGQRRRARHQSRSRRESSNSRFASASRFRLRARQQSSRSTTRASRTVPTCGAITAWRAKWPRSSGCELTDPAKLELLPAGVPRRSRSRSKISNSVRDTARWSSRTSRCSPRPCGCNTG